MTSMSVLYLRTVGQPLGALSTTIPGDPPALGQASTLRILVPVPNPSIPGQSIPLPITVERDDLAIAELETEFDDPLKVSEWRVVTSQGTDGSQQRHLDRLGSEVVTLTATSSGKDLLLDVPKFGNELKSKFQVRNEAGFIDSRVLNFGADNSSRTAVVNVPDTGIYVAFVENYAPAVLARIIVTRGGTGANQGLEVTLDVPRRAGKATLNYEVTNAGTSHFGTLDYEPADARKTVTVTVTDKTACQVSIDGYAPITVPDSP
jgi:hypothetical protein